MSARAFTDILVPTRRECRVVFVSRFVASDAPCFSCIYRKACLSKRLACDAFEMFSGGDSRWLYGSRHATRAQFDQLQGD